MFSIRGDVFKYIENSSEKFDFIFADPPYELKGLETISQLIFEKGLLKEDGLFVWSMVRQITLRMIPTLWKGEYMEV